MAANEALTEAKRAKRDEFYTQYEDIQAEINTYLEFDPDVFRNKTVLLPCDDPEWSNFTRFFAQNFETLGLKKLISTSYAVDSQEHVYRQLTIFEINSPQFDEDITSSRGKIFILDRDTNHSGAIDIEDLEWQYLEGDGDFRSSELKALRDEADIVVTNPPFSLFREFVAWIVEGEKQFSIIGNQNAITYKEIFPLLKDNKMWLGASIHSGDRKFNVPDDYPLTAASGGIDEDGKKWVRVKGIRWFTNIENGRTNRTAKLMTMADNIKFSKHKQVREEGYPKYDNYDAIEVPFSDAIPSDYEPGYLVPIEYKQKLLDAGFKLGSERNNSNNEMCVCVLAMTDRQTDRQTDRVLRSLQLIIPQEKIEYCNGMMGVPITFLDKYNPSQFEIVGADFELVRPIAECIPLGDTYQKGGPALYLDNGDGSHLRLYKRLLIRQAMSNGVLE